MIGKTHSGAGFGGLARYLLTGRDGLNPDRVLWTSTRGLALDDPYQATPVMRATADQGNTGKPVQHLSISLGPGEHLTCEQWEQVVDTTLRDLGLQEHQALIVAHQDTAQEHIHIMINRVHPETHRAWDRWQDRPRLMASLRKQELALGLQPTPHIKDPDRLPDPLVQGFERTGEPPLLDYARAVARPAFQEAGSWSELHQRLAEQGLYLERKGQGIVVTDDHRQVKASSVDRSASLRALEGRLGPYQEPRPQLQEVDRALRDEHRERELVAQLTAVHDARQELSIASAARDHAAEGLDRAAAALRSMIESVYRDPEDATRRYLAQLRTGDAFSHPSQLGELQGTFLGTGRYSLPLGAEANRAYRVASGQLSHYGAAYMQAQGDHVRAEARLADTRRHHEQLERLYRPQLDELSQLSTRHGRSQLPERVMSLRPKDQIALARVHGAAALEHAAKRAPEVAARAVGAREWWMQNLAPQLDRALDRQLSRHGIPPPSRGQSPSDWMVNTVRRGLRPAHGAQALLRAGVSLADTLRATSRALALTRAFGSSPVKAAATLAAQALSVPALPVRLAAVAWSLARRVVRPL